ncbi:MAG: hypothetical protein CMN57_02130 [Gammaproteobacteria bacterium]|nr:hypothetical protein [Gammaproteobacteria bacterium]
MNCLIRTLLPLLLLVPGLPAVAEPEPPAETDNRRGVVESVGESVRHGWEATRKGVGHAADITREKAGQGWEKTKEVAGATADWTREKSRQAWDATREGAAATSEWVREKAGRREPAPGDGAGASPGAETATP